MYRRIFFCLLFLKMGYSSYAQSTESRFSKLSGPEKWWVIWHPLKAKRALNISLEVLRITDSISKTGSIGHDRNGGKLDAFKHCYWMAFMTEEIGETAALKLGEAHERGNYKTFKKGKLEDGFLPDKPSSEMDLFNNKMGAELSGNKTQLTSLQLMNGVIEMIENGKLRILKKENATFLTCNGQVIASGELKGKWINDKCLIPSNQ
jgi:hypothetical protein